MSPNKLYSTVILKTVRYISLITFFLLIFTTTLSTKEYFELVYGKDLHIINTIAYCSGLLVNLTTIVFAIILIFHPQRFFLIGIGSLLQSRGGASFSPYSYMPLLMPRSCRSSEVG